MAADDYQVGGDHYRNKGGEAHWNRLIRLFGWHRAKVYWIGNITAYVERHEEKGGIQDLKKAMHYLEKMLEEEEKYQAEQERLKTAILEKNPGLAPLFSDEATGPGAEEPKGEPAAEAPAADGTTPPPSKAVCADCGEYYPVDDLLKEGWVYCKFCRLKEASQYQRRVQPITMQPAPSFGNSRLDNGRLLCGCPGEKCVGHEDTPIGESS